MITIKKITSKSDLKKFVKFPFSIFKDNPYSPELHSFKMELMLFKLLSCEKTLVEQNKTEATIRILYDTIINKCVNKDTKELKNKMLT